jgi:hypothetical protein
VVEELEGQVVRDQVLGREPVVVRIPGEELLAERGEQLPSGQLRGLDAEEEIVERGSG